MKENKEIYNERQLNIIQLIALLVRKPLGEDGTEQKDPAMEKLHALIKQIENGR